MDDSQDSAVVVQYLTDWGLSETAIKNFEDNQITLNLMQNIKDPELKELIPNLKERILFKNGLEKLKCIIHDTESEDTASVASSVNSYISESSSVSGATERIPRVDLKTILENNSSGELCLAALNKNHKLDPSSRGYLVKSVVEYYLKEFGVMKREDFEEIVQQILILVPTEEKETYYIPCQKFGLNKYIPARGKLVDKYNNQKRVLRKSGMLPTRRPVRALTSEPETSHAVFDDENVSDEEFEELKLWLKFNKEPLNEIIENWKKTSRRRLQELLSEKFKSIQDVLIDWPAYKLSIGYILIEQDFEAKFPGLGIELYKKWPTFLQKALPHFKTIKAAEEYMSCAIETQNEDVRDFCYLYTIGFKIIPTTRVTYKDTNGRKKSVKPSIQEALNAFVLHAKNQSEVRTKLHSWRNVQLSKGLRCQPVIIVVGAAINTVTDFYVSYDDILYKHESFLKAVDSCFKTFHCLDAKYPEEAIHIWTFVQKYFYNMELSSDKKLSGVASFMSDLK